MKTTNHLACWIAVLALGCSAMLPTEQTLHVSSDDGAELYIDNVFVGHGAGSLAVPRNKPHTVHAQLEGNYRTQTVGCRVSEAGILDVIGGLFFIAPFLGATTPGFWSLETERVYLPMSYEAARAAEQEPEPEPETQVARRPARKSLFFKTERGD